MPAAFIRCRCARNAPSSSRSFSSKGVRLITYTLGTRVMRLPSDRCAEAGAIECCVQHAPWGEGIADGLCIGHRIEEIEARAAPAGEDHGIDTPERGERVG